MSGETCKTCRWSAPARPGQSGGEQCQCHLEADSDTYYADWWCSHWQPGEDSPGVLNFVRQYGPDKCEHVIVSNDQYQQAVIKNLERVLPKVGQMKTFRLVPVE